MMRARTAAAGAARQEVSCRVCSAVQERAVRTGTSRRLRGRRGSMGSVTRRRHTRARGRWPKFTTALFSFKKISDFDNITFSLLLFDKYYLIIY